MTTYQASINKKRHGRKARTTAAHEPMPEQPWLLKHWKTGTSAALIILTIAIAAIACGQFLPQPGGPPFNAATVNVTANTSLKPWLDGTVTAFNNSGTKTADGKTAYVQLTYVEAGQAVADIAGGKATPDVWIPDDPVWAAALAQKGNSNYQSDCVSVATSPLVIAMWRPLAESLGWPGNSLGWLDVGSLAADPTAWAYYSGGQFGPSLKLGHTHPGLSASGAETLLALVQAAQSKTEAVTATDVDLPIVKASVGSFESAVSWFSKSTDSLGETMQARGISYLGAAVMYESTVVHYGGGDPGLVAIYPFEGTFVASHPACVNTSSAVKEAATAFRTYLLDVGAQKAALAAGLRPVNAAVPLGAPLDSAHGVDVTQPKTVFGAPTVDTLLAVQSIWSAARKPVNLVMVIDTSGSMEGDKIKSVQSAATQFVKQMGDNDYLTLISFASEPQLLINHELVGPVRDQAVQTVDGLDANGGTALYDAIGTGAQAITGTTSNSATNVMVVLTDGLDTSSKTYSFNQALIQLAAGNNTTVFTIAFGDDADKDSLAKLAQQANGNFYLGNEASIASIYDEMSAAFGGSAGVGR